MATGTAIWLAGDHVHPDFAAATRWLHANCRIIDLSGEPTAIVVMQSRPGSVARNQMELLHRQAPLARLMLLSGPWCDGELHRREPLPGIIRIRWHQWKECLPRELTGEFRLPLPRTASDGERLERNLHGLYGRFAGGIVAIRTDRQANYHYLADSCWALGLRPNWHAVEESVDALLIDGWQNDLPREVIEGPSPRILLLDFPRPEDLQRAAELDFAAVIAQPLSLADLAAAFDGLNLPSRAADSRVT